MTKSPVQIKVPKGKLGVLLPGMGAVATTFIAGVEAIKLGIAQPIGSLTQIGTIRLGKRTEKRTPMIKEFVQLASLKDLVFGGWDIFEDDCYRASKKAGVLEQNILEKVKKPLQSLKPWKAVFDQQYVHRLSGSNVKKGKTKWDLAQMLRNDIRAFKKKNGLSRMVMIWCASPEAFMKPDPVHDTIEAFEKGLKENHPAIAPSMIYAYGALCEGVPFANGAPNLTADIPAMNKLSTLNNVPIAGKDFKTGQTWMKTVVAPGLKARLLGLAAGSSESSPSPQPGP